MRHQNRCIASADCFSLAQFRHFDVYRVDIENPDLALTVLPMPISPARRWYHLQPCGSEQA